MEFEEESETESEWDTSLNMVIALEQAGYKNVVVIIED